MRIDIIITKGSETLVNASVTCSEIPAEYINILKTVHGSKMEITRKD